MGKPLWKMDITQRKDQATFKWIGFKKHLADLALICPACNTEVPPKLQKLINTTYNLVFEI